MVFSFKSALILTCTLLLCSCIFYIESVIAQQEVHGLYRTFFFLDIVDFIPSISTALIKFFSIQEPVLYNPKQF